jgi:cytoskeletal protein CcmA (bactofilin family)
MSDGERDPDTARSRASRLFGKRLLSQPAAPSGRVPEPGAPARNEPPVAAPARPQIPASPAFARPPAPQPPMARPAVAQPAVSQPVVPRAAITRPGPLSTTINPRSPGRVLIVGGDIRFSGEIKSCERLIVEGGIDIAEFGGVRGKATVGTCEVRGTFEGELTVLGLLSVRAGGRVRGTVRYAEVMVERGGTITGDVDLRGPQPTAAPAPETTAPGPTGPRPA